MNPLKSSYWFSNDIWGCIQSFQTGRLERELQMIQLSATSCSCIAVLWVSLVSFTAITLCVASQRVCCCLFRYRLRPETFGYTLVRWIHRTLKYFTQTNGTEMNATCTTFDKAGTWDDVGNMNSMKNRRPRCAIHSITEWHHHRQFISSVYITNSMAQGFLQQTSQVIKTCLVERSARVVSIPASYSRDGFEAQFGSRLSWLRDFVVFLILKRLRGQCLK